MEGRERTGQDISSFIRNIQIKRRFLVFEFWVEQCNDVRTRKSQNNWVGQITLFTEHRLGWEQNTFGKLKMIQVAGGDRGRRWANVFVLSNESRWVPMCPLYLCQPARSQSDFVSKYILVNWLLVFLVVF